MTKEQFKTYFNANFAGVQNLIDIVLTPMLGQFTSKTLTDRIADMGDGNANINHIFEYGSYQVVGEVSVWEVVLSDNCRINQARKNIQNVVRQLLGTYSGAFVIFHYADGSTNPDAATWRLSWIKKEATQAGATSAKRYTYLCGPAYSCRTIAERFDVLQNTPSKTLDSITAAFDVEALSDEFFYNFRAIYSKIKCEGEKWKSKKYTTPYAKLSDIKNDKDLGFCDFIERYKNDTRYFGEEFTRWESKLLRDYIKKMMGRLVFLQFLQKKGWMCGNPNYLKSLFEKFVQGKRENVTDTAPGSFLDEVLEPLFFGVLNTKAKDREELFKNEKWNLDLLNEWKDIPYLNGGLFEQEVYDKPKSAFPNVLFNELFTLFSEYNFTIDENDPDDKEVGIDPEMLSKIFESQLEDNKDKGAFYTPKEIVEYMCKESLIAYLQTDITDEGQKENIRSFVCDREAALQDGLKLSVAEKLKNVKICDPAIGSGAFPMGMLNLLVSTREKIESVQNRLELKKEIICNNLYGVDIEKGAVDIARLRFWLSLVIDEDEPAALPNLDYKIMQGNSLLEQYEGVDLSGMSLNEQAKSKVKKGQSWQQTLVFDEQGALDNIQNAIRESFATEDHDKKNELREIINENIKNYIYNLKDCTLEIQQKLATLPIPNDQFFLWHIYFKEVFDNGGFDIVIGNPPYFNIQTLGANSSYANTIKKAYSKIWQDKSDILFYFFELAMELSKNVIMYITSNAYPFSDKAKKLRNSMIDDGRLRKIVNFERYLIFKSADVTTCITTFSNLSSDFVAVNYKEQGGSIENVIAYISDDNNQYKVNLKKDSVFALVNSVVSNVNDIIDGNHPQLSSVVKVGKGMETAADEVFLFDSYPSQFPSSCIKKRVTGKNMGKYIIFPDNEYILYAEDFESFEVLPDSIKQHLLSNDSLLKDRATVKNEGREWWRYSRPMHKELYKFPKLYCSRRASKNIFCLDDSNDYLGFSNMTVIFDTNKDYPIKYILGLVNSSLLNYRYKSIGKQTGGGIYEYFPNGIGKLPIYKPTKEQSASIITLVDRILAAKKANPQADTSAWEKEIDKLVYELYGLTEEEIRIVEGKE